MKFSMVIFVYTNKKSITFVPTNKKHWNEN